MGQLLFTEDELYQPFIEDELAQFSLLSKTLIPLVILPQLATLNLLTKELLANLSFRLVKLQSQVFKSEKGLL